MTTIEPPARQPSVLGVIIGVVVVVVLLAIAIIVIRYFLPAQPPQFSNQPELPQAVRMTQEAQLNSLGWVDKATGAAHIPIDRAMQIIASQGVPTLVEIPGQVTPQPGATGGAAGGPAAQGAALFQSLGCIGCHSGQPGAVAPNLKGIYGKPVQLESGQTVTADDAYIRESILSPQAKIVKGFGPIMPSFQGQVNDQQINELIAYIKSLQ